jgi:hypothetical protein
MDLKIGKLREIIASSIGVDFQADGFEIDKTLTWYKKKVNIKNKIHVFIDCYNYAPFRLEYSLVFQFLIKEIENERERIYKLMGTDFQRGPTFTFSEGYFHPKTKYLEHKYQNAFTHIVTDFSMIHETIEDCRKVLNGEIIPKFPIFSQLENFQEYVIANYHTIGESALTIPSIIAMKLKGQKELELISKHLWEKLSLELMPENHSLRQFIKKILSD